MNIYIYLIFGSIEKASGAGTALTTPVLNWALLVLGWCLTGLDRCLTGA